MANVISGSLFVVSSTDSVYKHYYANTKVLTPDFKSSYVWLFLGLVLRLECKC